MQKTCPRGQVQSGPSASKSKHKKRETENGSFPEHRRSLFPNQAFGGQTPREQPRPPGDDRHRMRGSISEFVRLSVFPPFHLRKTSQKGHQRSLAKTANACRNDQAYTAQGHEREKDHQGEQKHAAETVQLSRHA